MNLAVSQTSNIATKSTAINGNFMLRFLVPVHRFRLTHLARGILFCWGMSPHEHS